MAGRRHRRWLECTAVWIGAVAMSAGDFPAGRQAARAEEVAFAASAKPASSHALRRIYGPAALPSGPGGLSDARDGAWRYRSFADPFGPLWTVGYYGPYRPWFYRPRWYYPYRYYAYPFFAPYSLYGRYGFGPWYGGYPFGYWGAYSYSSPYEYSSRWVAEPGWVPSGGFYGSRAGNAFPQRAYESDSGVYW